MNYGKFVLAGEDKKTLAFIKNVLVSNDHIYTGYTQEPLNILSLVRRHSPDLAVIDAGNKFGEISETLNVIDDEMLTACILVLEKRNDGAFDFLLKTRTITYITKPVFTENVLQAADISILNYTRVMEYERKVKQLNDTLENRKIIEKAKWILVKQNGISEEEAHEFIRKRSRDSRTPMIRIAEAIILTRNI